MKNLLVPTDFSTESHNAYEVALQLAKQTGGRVTLLHVLETPEMATANFSTYGGPVNGVDLPNYNAIADEEFIIRLMQMTKLRMHAYKDEAARLAPGVPVQDTVEIARIGDGILAAIEKHGIDLVVMGAQGHGAMEHFFVGSNTERMIRLASCPVLTVKHQQPEFNVRTMVFPSDFSPEASRAVAGLQRVRVAFPNATLHLLHVATHDHDAVDQHQLQAFATRHHLTHYKTAVVKAERLSSGIEAYAQQVQADLVLLPTHAHSGLSTLLRTSIAEAVATHAFPPVLTYHFQ
ncbi:hypothetical protein AUC43_17210 [Hymenobacter sedentarius]|uniref:UspA domain-containing protein n=1 Tax=Hymenobacter sedentarius TaxID=1411621 RepID=A0A0U4CEU0_9BACT|nr:universal stress protein [Hymenobacter sedentarius]ALW86665.1 hypothetical protein AUC43_17210 [Hymenobacter sedentarius]